MFLLLEMAVSRLKNTAFPENSICLAPVMLTVNTVEQLREQITHWKQEGFSIGFVPTMGNLHAGHLALIDRAKKLADKVIVSVFVNPTQFGPNEDYETYPRTLDDDASALKQHATDLLFTPSVETMYGDTEDDSVVTVPDLNHILCGVSRPGFFNGVATVVSKLFKMVQPDIAIFGQKDFQQLLVIRAMVQDLDFPIEIIGHETQREADGLAMSSRNGYLTSEERQLAPQIYTALNQIVDEAKKGTQNYLAYCEKAIQRLSEAGFEVDYVEIRRQTDLKIPELDDKSLVVLIAAKLGKTRLIDNLLFELE